jgi:3-oxoacyl-[acyl-carrier-protein] synthase II
MLCPWLGPNMAITAVCATGGQNISEGMELIRRGDAKVVIAGGSEAPLHPTILASFTTMHGLACGNAHPEQACKPFDVGRDGFVLAEGAGALVLEELTHAQACGAPIIAEIIGHGNSNDAYDMIAADADGCGIARAMQMALRRAALERADVEGIITRVIVDATPQNMICS